MADVLEKRIDLSLRKVTALEDNKQSVDIITTFLSRNRTLI